MPLLCIQLEINLVAQKQADFKYSDLNEPSLSIVEFLHPLSRCQLTGTV